MTAETAASSVQSRFRNAVESVTEFRDEHTVKLSKDRMHDALKYCREELDFDYLVDMHTASVGRVNSLYVRADLDF